MNKDEILKLQPREFVRKINLALKENRITGIQASMLSTFYINNKQNKLSTGLEQDVIDIFGLDNI